MVHFEAPIDLEYKQINNLGDSSTCNNGDAVNLKQLNRAMNSFLSILTTNTEILKVTFFTFRS